MGCVDKKFLRRSVFFTRVKIFYLSQNFLRGSKLLSGLFFFGREKGVGGGSR